MNKKEKLKFISDNNYILIGIFAQQRLQSNFNKIKFIYKLDDSHIIKNYIYYCKDKHNYFVYASSENYKDIFIKAYQLDGRINRKFSKSYNKRLVIFTPPFFKELTISEFKVKFATAEACREFLFNYKYKDGYICCNCGNNKFSHNSNRNTYQCSKCRNIESPTNGTIYHRLRFDIVLAFYITYLFENKLIQNCNQLAKELGMYQFTCYNFIKKLKSFYNLCQNTTQKD